MFLAIDARLAGFIGVADPIKPSHATQSRTQGRAFTSSWSQATTPLRAAVARQVGVEDGRRKCRRKTSIDKCKTCSAPGVSSRWR
jgi:hypothetical protein